MDQYEKIARELYKDTPVNSEQERQNQIDFAVREMRKQAAAQANGSLDANTLPRPNEPGYAEALIAAGINPSSGGSGAGSASAIKNTVNAEYGKAETQIKNAVDAGTKAAVESAKAAAADASAELDAQRGAISLEEARSLDNSALYAELRGDRGGIGKAQYDSIQSAANSSRAAVNSAQTKLARDAALKIGELQAKGEYEKAERLLELTQDRLGALMKLYSTEAQYAMDEKELNAKLEQWRAEYELSAAKLEGKTLSGELNAESSKQLASFGKALLEKGLMPSAEQLAAMGMSEAQARLYIRSGSKTETAVTGTDEWFLQLYEKYGENTPLMLQYNYTALGVSTKSASDSLLERYRIWHRRNAE